ncbi:adenine nucleotide translocase lysine N-methyltransferase isoform X2 [Engraulis encrasicolus]|uniref:adenine nucleotide translocase lysine N-methyltransferase isoform X2 n=1 Tax=Engraulis encrasicolus TaxID=184585 RepID=UPI002FD79C5A
MWGTLQVSFSESRRFLSRKYSARPVRTSDTILRVKVVLFGMDDDIDVLLQERRLGLDHPTFTACTGALLLGIYRLWTVFALPGFRKVPINLKVPYLPSSKTQTQNVMKALRGRTGCLADLGSGDGRLVFAAYAAAGLRCTGFEINSMLAASARARAWWRGLPACSVSFVSRDFWQMEVLGEKLVRELQDEALVVACRFPFPGWPCSASEGRGLDQVWVYDMRAVRRHLSLLALPTPLPEAQTRRQ